MSCAIASPQDSPPGQAANICSRHTPPCERPVTTHDKPRLQLLTGKAGNPAPCQTSRRWLSASATGILPACWPALPRQSWRLLVHRAGGTGAGALTPCRPRPAIHRTSAPVAHGSISRPLCICKSSTLPGFRSGGGQQRNRSIAAPARSIISAVTAAWRQCQCQCKTVQM